MGVMIENERLLGSESVGQPDDTEQRPTPRWARRMKKRIPPWIARWQTVLLALIFMGVSIGFLASSYRFSKTDGRKTTIRPHLPSDNVASPAGSQQPVQQDSAKPASDTLGAGGKQEPLQSTFCQNARYRFPEQAVALDFGPDKNITFMQDQLKHAGRREVRVGGQVNVRRHDGGGEARILLEIVTNDKDIRLEVIADSDDNFMSITTPQKANGPGNTGYSCVEMRATIWVPSGAQLNELYINAVHLDVLLLDDLAIKVGAYTTIQSVFGDIVSGGDKSRTYEHLKALPEKPDYTFVPAKASYQIDSRILEVKTTSGRIEGNFPLMDMLGLHTTSGDIDASITPKPELATDPKPAVLSLSSVSGTIHATEPMHLPGELPIREYQVVVKSTSGGIHGAFAFGSGVELKSTASDIAVDLLPIFDAGKLNASHPAQLETVTTSGTTALRVLEPIWFGEEQVPALVREATETHLSADKPANGAATAPQTRPCDCLQAIHKSTSAAIGLRYPQSWVGNVRAEATTGRVSLKGKDVKITKAASGPAGVKAEAYKGRDGGASTLQMHTLSGALDALIGDE